MRQNSSVYRYAALRGNKMAHTTSRINTLWYELVEEVIIRGGGQAEFHLANGEVITVKI